ncbi:MAG TPA: HipA domain-containing protein [Candidatus Obscuribacterales bacterium]
MPPDAPVVEDAAVPFAVRRISDSELKRHILELAQKPLFIGVEGLKLSLAGVQEKAAVIVLDEEICLPLSGTPTSHILKPGNARFPALVQNEFLCMRAAVRMGLRVPAVQIRAAEDQLYLLVARYDREVGATILRIHQEDFCQALGRREKYQIFGGPNLKDCFELMMRSSLPVVDRRALMQAVIFNYLIGNSDAHGKNLSVIHVRPEFVRLAPLYDLVCTQIYPSVSRDMAMKIGKEYQFDRVSAGDWRKLAGDAGFSFPALRQLLQKYLSELPAAVEVERQALKGTRFDADELDAIVDFVRAHCAKTFNRLRDE